MLNKHKSLQSKGFTLLEIMLVIAIIAAIAVLGLSGYKQLVMNRKIEKASVEMQMWVQASLQYYVNVGGDIDSKSTKLTTQHVIDSGLMNANDVGNPWVESTAPVKTVGAYILAPVAITDGTGYKIEVSTEIPTVDIGQKEADEIARMIAGRLPFGVATNNTVSMTIV